MPYTPEDKEQTRGETAPLLPEVTSDTLCNYKLRSGGGGRRTSIYLRAPIYEALWTTAKRAGSNVSTVISFLVDLHLRRPLEHDIPTGEPGHAIGDLGQLPKGDSNEEQPPD